MRRRVALALASTTLLALAAGATSASARTRYYLSLGDSLAQGMQPRGGGITVNTGEGYADQLYAMKRARIGQLKLVKLGCGGESTASFATGHGNPLALLLGCNPAGGSQLVAGERFLRAHRRRGEVAFVTLDIGANDVVGCASGASFDIGCVTRGVQSIDANLPQILRRLRRTAGPGVAMAAMTLYDPFLQLYLIPEDQGEALLINAYARNLNRALERIYRAGGFRVAHVDRAFRTYDTSTTTTIAGQPGPVPVAVAEVCRLTWMCAPRPSGRTSTRTAAATR
jgi:hypothetical protein